MDKERIASIYVYLGAFLVSRAPVDVTVGTHVLLEGSDTARRAQKFCDNIFVRACNVLRCHNLDDCGDTSVAIIGAESQFGVFAAGPEPREVVAKIAGKHDEAAAIIILLRGLTDIGLATPLGLNGLNSLLPPEYFGSLDCASAILLKNYYLPGDLEAQVEVFVEHYNHQRYQVQKLLA